MKTLCSFVLISVLSLVAFVIASNGGQEREIYIAYFGEKTQGDFAASVHHSILHRVIGSSSLAKESLIYSYGRSFNGFAAKLTDEEAARISAMEGVVSVFKDKILRLHTTRSWDFMGLPISNVGVSQESDVVIGFLDTGIWPESESFNDEGMGPPPAGWKGVCTGVNFTCNNKIIGARFYKGGGLFDPHTFTTPRDFLGHGTHASSTAAGRLVDGASYFGLAEGTARGGVPSARIAMYKVCWSIFCSGSAILAAFDDAIADGVHIISVSIGGAPERYFEDPIAIGSFHAMKNGILTSNSAGDGGPYPLSVTNNAPWTITVAASTIDRKFVSRVVLGNGQVINGLSINNFDLHGASFPLIWAGDTGDISAGVTSDLASLCFDAFINLDKVKGKIVLCQRSDNGSPLSFAKGACEGVIMADSTLPDVSLSTILPSSVISEEDGLTVLDYIRNTKNPTATILAGETPDDVMAPYVASFSSRGPNPVNPDILKMNGMITQPDITAPGVDILAAWPTVVPPSFDFRDTRNATFNVVSGTSISCPHVSGAAAYVKASHPNWSPAAIKSALMTTAHIMDRNKNSDHEFAYGSGHLNPINATDPGLVYDASEADYIKFLCREGYNATTIKLLTGENTTTCAGVLPGNGWELNYPSFSVAVVDGQEIFAVFKRVVTNVGSPKSTYNVRLDLPSLISVTVEPPELSFSAIGENQSFTVKVSGPKISQQQIVSGAILWEDGVHVVRSPLVVYTIVSGGFDILSTQKIENSKQGWTRSRPVHFHPGTVAHGFTGVLPEPWTTVPPVWNRNRRPRF